MAGQPENRQKFRFWFPFTSQPSPPLPRVPSSSSQPQQKTQSKPDSAPSDQSQTSKRMSRAPSPSPSPTKQKQKQKEPTPPQSPWRKLSRSTSSSSSSPTQSPSRRLEDVKQKKKDEPPQPSRLSPSPSQSAKKPREVSLGNSSTNEVIHEPKEHDSKTPDKNLDQPTEELSKVENDSSNLDNSESKPLPFDPLIGVKPNKTVLSERNPVGNREDKTRENYELTPQVEEDQKLTSGISKLQLKEEDQNMETMNNIHDITATNENNLNETMKPESPKETIEEENPKEMITEIEKPSQDENPKETIKEMAKSSEEEEVPHTEKPIFTIIPEPPSRKDEQSSLDNLNSNNERGSPVRNNHNSTEESSDEKSQENESSTVKRENLAENYPRRIKKPLASTSKNRSSFQKDIKEGISKLVQNINTGNPHNPRSENGTFIITLAGENKGASMHIGHKNDKSSSFSGRGHKLNENKAESSNENCKEKQDDKENKNLEISSNVNSNVQSINNSVLQESSCTMRDPGVRLIRTKKGKNEKTKTREN